MSPGVITVMVGWNAATGLVLDGARSSILGGDGSWGDAIGLPFVAIAVGLLHDGRWCVPCRQPFHSDGQCAGGVVGAEGVLFCFVEGEETYHVLGG